MKNKIVLILLVFGALFSLKAADYTTTATYKIDDKGVTVTVVLDIPKELHVYKEQFFAITDTKVSGLGDSSIIYPKTKKYFDAFADANVDVYVGKSIFKITKPFTSKDKSWQWTLTFESQACTDSSCLPPKSDTFSFASKASTSDVKEIEVAETDELSTLISKFDIVGTDVGFKEEAEFLKFLKNDATASTKSDGIFANRGAWMILLLVLLGGLGLNLTPCILPMIPINLAIIGAGSATGSKFTGFKRGLYYGLGITFAYGILGVVATLGGASFGTINSTVWFNVTIAIIFVLLGLAMIDVFIIDLSKFKKNSGTNKAKSGKFLPVFLLGGVSALLAGACVAPIVIAVLIYSTTQYQSGNVFGLALPFILGLGMALPWPFAGAGMGVLPKPGMWMEKIKMLMAIFIFAFAGFYAYTAYSLWDAKNYSAESEVMKLTKSLQEAEVSGKPVFIDFWATWCGSCMKMKETTLKTKSVSEELKRFEEVYFQAEDPNNPLIKDVMEKFKVKGLPTYIILKKK